MAFNITVFKFKRRSAISKALFLFLLVNLVITLLIGYSYILHGSGFSSLFSFLFVHIALVSHFVTFYVIIGIFLYLILLFFPFKNAVMSFSVLTIFLFHSILFIDAVIFRIYRFHINSMVLNLFLTEGTWDSVKIGTLSLITAVTIICAILAFEVFLFNKLYKKVKKHPQRWFPKISHIIPIIAIILAVIVVDKFTFAFSDLYKRKNITRYKKIFPLYQPLTIKQFMRNNFNFKLDREKKFDIHKKSESLNYPKEPLKRKKIKKYLNIIWILIDAWRYDMLDKEVCPNIWRFSKRSLVFKNHYSGGNASRFGVFSLFYGIYSYYWHQFLSECQSPVFIDELIKLEYDFKIMSSTKLTYPEFRRTAFIKIPDSISDRMVGNCIQRDTQMTRDFTVWLKKRKTKKPFFAFLFFDSPHNRAYPKGFNKFTPAVSAINYVAWTPKDMPPLRNAYKNAILFDDSLMKQIISCLKENKLLKNTIVIFSGDHGEEFNESGYFGHTSAFSKEQVKVPLVMYIPGQKHKEINYMTSHLDVVPTMLSLLGYTTQPDIYSQGQSLLQNKNRRFVVAGGWDDSAIIDQENTIVFSTESYNLSCFEVRDSNYKLLDDYDHILKERFPMILEIGKKFGEFIK